MDTTPDNISTEGDGSESKTVVKYKRITFQEPNPSDYDGDSDDEFAEMYLALKLKETLNIENKDGKNSVQEPKKKTKGILVKRKKEISGVRTEFKSKTLTKYKFPHFVPSQLDEFDYKQFEKKTAMVDENIREANRKNLEKLSRTFFLRGDMRRVNGALNKKLWYPLSIPKM